ncbi:hypothetical protein [Limimaricola soesokkakensis]|uniref:hypothetical protein n=1 Tax=Limimaricola soesokkakensis TaxID=1343159 RepID=UPI0035121BAA
MSKHASHAVEGRMLDAAGVAGALRRWVPLGATVAENWAREWRILGVARNGATAYPAWQFDQAGLPISAMRDVLLSLRPALDAEEMLAWLHAPCAALGDRAPCDVLREDPEAVKAAARQRGAEPTRYPMAG